MTEKFIERPLKNEKDKAMQYLNSLLEQARKDNRSEDIENLEGSKVYTSGMGGIFPSGILIGEVFKIEEDKYDVSKTIKVTPASDFSNFRFVKVLIRKEYAS